jgi:uncharacterized membrane protein
MATSPPIRMFWLKIGTFEALAADFVVITLVVVYTYVFTLIYDRTFPLRHEGPMQA